MLHTIGTFLVSFVTLLIVGIAVGWTALYIWAFATIFINEKLGIYNAKAVAFGLIFALSFLFSGIGATWYTLFWR